MNVLRRLKALFFRHRLEQDLQDEMNSHMAMDEQERIGQGESLEDAHSHTRRDFGNSLLTAEDVRATWGTAPFEHFIQDLHYALRQMKRKPGFTITIVLTLALGIGANTAVFTIVNAILLRPLPYVNSDRLVRIVENIPAGESFSGAPERSTSMSVDEVPEWRARSRTLSGFALEMPAAMTLRGQGAAVRITGTRVSPALFPMLGVHPILGRSFLPSEESSGSEKVIALSYATWQQLFGGDPQILGKTLALDNAGYRVVGVMPEGFLFPNPQNQFWIPFPLGAPTGGIFKVQVTARLNDGVPLAAATAEANAIGRQLRGEPQDASQPPGLPRIQLISWKDDLVASIRLPFLVLAIAVTFVLLVACINVANFFFARGTARHREFAIRSALGAGRGRVFRQLLTESLILVFSGGVLGIGLAFAGSRLLVVLGHSLSRTDLLRFEGAGNAIPRLSEVSMDFPVLVFAVAITAATAILFGFLPAFQLRGAYAIRSADLESAGSSKLLLRFLRPVLIVVQIAVTTVLLLGAGLLTRSFVKLAKTDLGFNPANVLTFTIPQPTLSYPEDIPKQRQRTIFAEDVVRLIEAIPGIEAVAFTNMLPMVQMSLGIDLKPESGGTPIPGAEYITISSDYFRVMGMRLIEGRALSAKDRNSSRAAYVINRTLARMYSPHSSAIGKTITSGPGVAAGEVVGVVNDSRRWGPDAEPKPSLFVDAEHTIGIVGTTDAGVYFVIRTANKPAFTVSEIRRIVRELDPTLAVDNVATMNQILSNAITTPRSYAVLLGIFAVSALTLATIGLYGLLAYFVSQRTQEIGVRLAIGAERSDVLLLVLRQGLAVGATGLTLGVAGGLVLTRYLQTMLFGVPTLDFTTFLIVTLVFIAVTLAASLIPAHRAASIDPLIALRYE